MNARWQPPMLKRILEPRLQVHTCCRLARGLLKTTTVRSEDRRKSAAPSLRCLSVQQDQMPPRRHSSLTVLAANSIPIDREPRHFEG